MTNISFFVPGIPAPGGSKKAFPIHTGRFKPNRKGIPTEIIRVVVSDAAGQKNKDWRSSVIEACTSVFTSVPLRCPVKLNVIFYMPYRKGDFGIGKNKGVLKKDAPQFCITRPDATKLLRALEDALTSVLWFDDCQVVALQAVKIYSLRPGALVQVHPLQSLPVSSTSVIPPDSSPLVLP